MGARDAGLHLCRSWRENWVELRGCMRVALQPGHKVGVLPGAWSPRVRMGRAELCPFGTSESGMMMLKRAAADLRGPGVWWLLMLMGGR